MRLRFQIVHVLLSNPTQPSQVSAPGPAGQEHGAQASGLSINRHRVRLVYLQRAAVGGQTALCSLIPAQSATGPSHPEVNWSRGERVTAPVAAPKIKPVPSVRVAGGTLGVSEPPEMAEVQPLQARDGHLHLRERWLLLFAASEENGVEEPTWTKETFRPDTDLVHSG